MEGLEVGSNMEAIYQIEARVRVPTWGPFFTDRLYELLLLRYNHPIEILSIRIFAL